MDHAMRTEKTGGMHMQRHNLIYYALEAAPRPGAREIRVRPVPQGAKIRNKGEELHAEQKAAR